MSFGKFVFTGAMVVVLVFGISGESGAQGAVKSGEYEEGRIIVKLEEGVEPSDLRPLNARNDAETVEVLPEAESGVISLDETSSVPDAVAEYEDSPLVEYAEPDYIIEAADIAPPKDPEFSRQYGLRNTGQTGGKSGADIDAMGAWQSTTGSAGTVIAVIDTGVDISHPDLNDNIWVNTDEVAGNGKDDDGNGYVDDRNGYDFQNRDRTVFDDSQDDRHGTHVAGIIAAEGNNGLGVTGVNWKAKVMPLKILGPSGGNISAAIAAIDYAVANGAKVSNLSWGGGPKSQALEDAINRAADSGHLFVAAAGNGGSDYIGDDAATKPFYPAAYASPNIIAVAATDDEDALARFSNYGSEGVDVAAPGVEILSTYPGEKYQLSSGTSMASPYVAGVAGLMLSRTPGISASEMKSRIMSTSDPLASLEGKTVSGGRLDAAEAVNGTATPSGVPETSEPMGDTDAPGVTLSGFRPSSGAKTTSVRPVIGATVGNRSGVKASDIAITLDGKRVSGFSYSADTGRISFKSAKLSYGKHSVRVAVSGDGGDVSEAWTFRVVRR